MTVEAKLKIGDDTVSDLNIEDLEMDRLIQVTITDSEWCITHDQRSKLFMPIVMKDEHGEIKQPTSPYVARLLTKTMGGDITVEAAEGKGTVMCFEMRLGGN